MYPNGKLCDKWMPKRPCEAIVTVLLHDWNGLLKAEVSQWTEGYPSDVFVEVLMFPWYKYTQT